jgi:inositol transport system substrate-binding protein
LDTLPDNQAFVASNERDSGTLETKEACRLFKEAGKTEAKVYVIMGELEPGRRAATKDIDEVLPRRNAASSKSLTSRHRTGAAMKPKT